MPNLWPPYLCTLEYPEIFMFLLKKSHWSETFFQILKFIIISTFIWSLY